MWAAFPNRPLKGIGTPMVESLFSWAAFQCQAVGITPGKFFKMLEPNRTSSAYSPSLLTGPGSTFKDYSLALGRFCNATDLRCGTFYVASNITGKNFNGRRAQMAKWCPICIAKPPRELYLPLLFSLSTAICCPEHGCDLVENCPNCNAPQRQSWDPRKWTRCQKCQANLAHSPSYTPRGNDYDWMNQQSMELIDLCADPLGRAVSSDVLRIFIENFMINRLDSRVEPTFKDVIRKNYFLTDHKPSFRRLLMMCFAQGIGIRDLLMRPDEAASPGLFPMPESISRAPFSANSHITAHQLASIIADIQWFRAIGYVPDPRVLMRALDLPGSDFDTLAGDARDLYLPYAIDRENDWAELADQALRPVIKRMSLAIPSGSVSNCFAELWSDWKYRELRDRRGLRILALVAIRIALHSGVRSDLHLDSLDAKFRPLALAIMNRNY